MIKHFLNPPNWFTAASLFCGMYAIVLATGVEGEPNFYRAAVLILFAAVFDTIDGGVARLTKTGTDFGIQLDSLVDTVSFGVAPAVLLYAWGIHSLGTLGLVGAFAFAVCGVFRLARFNTLADGTKHAYTQGLTITMAGTMVSAAVMVQVTSGSSAVEHPFHVLLLALLLAGLMVSSIPYRGIKSLRIHGMGVIWLALFMGAVLVVGARYRVSTAFVGVLGLYVVAGPIEAVWRLRRGTAVDVLTDEVPDPLDGEADE